MADKDNLDRNESAVPLLHESVGQNEQSTDLQKQSLESKSILPLETNVDQLNGEAKSPTGSPGHVIKMEEVVPASSSYLDDSEGSKDWRTNLEHFTSKRYATGDKKKGKEKKQVKLYYKNQDELINAFEKIDLDLDDADEIAESEEHLRRMADRLAKLSFVCNLLLVIIETVAAWMSGSLAVVSSVVDSAVDLVAGALIWWSGRAIKKRDIYLYPQGRTKLEPIAIMILAVVMFLASAQLIRESIEEIIEFATVAEEGPIFELPTIIICVITVVIKLLLWVVCRGYSKSASVRALAQDHRHDVIFNTFAIICGYIGYKWWAYSDAIGAILICIYIMIQWFNKGCKQIRLLTGHTANPDFLKRITWLSMNHHPDILQIDTVRAFHFGNNFLVEVDVVLPEKMSLFKAHDIGESLQQKIERFPEVERAFVHLDYETTHSPFSEHKQV